MKKKCSDAFLLLSYTVKIRFYFGSISHLCICIGSSPVIYSRALTLTNILGLLNQLVLRFTIGIKDYKYIPVHWRSA